MYIFLIIWFLFILVYIVFNIYGISRVQAMRIKGDTSGLIILIYLITIFIILGISITIISHLNWTASLSNLIKI